MDEQFIRDRITELRIQKNISEYKMSLDLGHSKSYIQSISSGRAMPSMSEFLYICEYLNISPKDFFDTELNTPLLLEQASEGMKSLSGDDLNLLINIINRLNQK
ncbi:MAG: helix-turn-helix transcriptional regulator [Candidatus Choladocola sp.]|nr:helix-turn-helix transcriptional regulator [Candidatus Choladocola sp.]